MFQDVAVYAQPAKDKKIYMRFLASLNHLIASRLIYKRSNSEILARHE